MKYNKLENLNIKLNSKQIENFEIFENLFLDYNKKVNLISNKDSNFLFEKHIYDSLAFNLFYKKYNIKENIKLLDIGTGGGFPSTPLAIYYDLMQVCCIDSINKKINFIKYLKDELQIKNLNPICARIEESEIYKTKFDVVVSRAMAELRIILEYAIPALNVGGYFIAYKSIKADEEICNASNALSVLNSRLVEKIEYSLPINTENKRVLLVIQKLANVEKIYPRKNGLIIKKPL